MDNFLRITNNQDFRNRLRYFFLILSAKATDKIDYFESYHQRESGVINDGDYSDTPKESDHNGW